MKQTRFSDISNAAISMLKRLTTTAHTSTSGYYAAKEFLDNLDLEKTPVNKVTLNSITLEELQSTEEKVEWELLTTVNKGKKDGIMGRAVTAFGYTRQSSVKSPVLIVTFDEPSLILDENVQDELDLGDLI